ncbi:MAG TPA: hypothetical protein VMT53_03320 [Terriglobales bacterium]|nr:hypothetical protein [Terriglobales bacterium]
MASETGSSSETVTIEKSNSPEQPNPANRRAMIKKAGMFLGAASALAALGTPAKADAGADDIAGLWAGVVSFPGNLPPPFNTIIMTDGRIWTDSGQTDLTSAALDSTLWGAVKKIGHRQYHVVGRYWTYDPSANPTGYGTVDEIVTLSADGNSYHADFMGQFFDVNGNPLGPPSPGFEDAKRIA